MPLLSVVVPFYNVEAYLEATLRSIARQGHRDLEVILVDDGSTDSSAAIAELFALQDPRFQLIRSPHAGPSRARNLGLERATGEFLAFADGDDLVPPYAYGMMINTLRHTGSDVATGAVRRFNGRTLTPSKMLAVPFADTILRTHVRTFTPLLRDVTVWNKVYRRSLWQDNAIRFPEDLAFSEDAVSTLRAYALAGAVDVIRTPVYYWTIRQSGPRSITQRGAEPEILMQRIDAIGRVGAFLRDLGEAKLTRAWQDWTLRHHLHLIIEALPSVPAAQRQGVLDAAAAYLATVPAPIVERLAPRARLEIADLAAGRAPAASLGGASGLKQRAIRLGKRVARANALLMHLDAVTWEDGHVVVRGEMVLYGRTGHLPRVGALAVWLREVETSRRSRIRMKALQLAPREPGVASAPLEIRVDPAELKIAGKDAWRTGRWVLSANVAAGRNAFRAVVGPSEANGPVPVPDARRLDAGTWLAPVLADDRLELWVTRQRAVRAGTALDGALLRLTVPLDAGMATGATVGLGRVDGIPEDVVPAHVTSGSGGAVLNAAIDLDRVAAMTGPDEPAPAGGILDRWQVWLQAGSGDATYPIVVDPGAAIRHAAGHVAAAHGDAMGRLAITVRPAIPTATSLTWEPGAELVVTGDGPVGPEDRIVARLSAQAEEHEWPIATTPGGWHARLTPAAAASAAGSVPLRRGAWRLGLRTRRDGAVYDTDLPIGGAALDEVSLVGVAGRTYWLTRAEPDGALLRCGGALRGDENHRASVRYVHEVLYPRRRRTAPLRDAVLYASFAGRQYSDSPRAIHEELVRRRSRLEHQWVVRDAQVPLPPTARPVSYESRAYGDALATARFIVTNNHLPEWFRRRDGQVVVQTWHGTPLKRIGFDVLDNRHADKDYLRKLAIDVPQWSYLVSPNSFSTPHLARAFNYTGEILETGYPRNDALADQSRQRRNALRALLADRAGIPADKKIILYAPTWRDEEYYGPGRYRLDFQLDTAAAARALGHDSVLLVRRHPSVVDDVPGAGDGFVFDVSAYPDMADLLAAADVLVTDYSSAMFDFAVTGRPMVFFAYDMEYYRDSLRGFYFDFDAYAPGPIVATSQEAVAALAGIDRVAREYETRYRIFRERFCDLDDGKATVRLVDRVFGP